MGWGASIAYCRVGANGAVAGERSCPSDFAIARACVLSFARCGAGSGPSEQPRPSGRCCPAPAKRPSAWRPTGSREVLTSGPLASCPRKNQEAPHLSPVPFQSCSMLLLRGLPAIARLLLMLSVPAAFLLPLFWGCHLVPSMLR